MFLLEKPEEFHPKMEVSGCFVICGGEMLLLLRQDHKSEGNKWGQPAGKIEPGEDCLSAARRELLEETGIEAGSNLRHFKTAYITYPEYSFTYHMFVVWLKEKPRTKVELRSHKKHQWFTPDEAQSLPLVSELDQCFKLYISQFPS